MTSRNLPVPEAHLSFVRNFSISPLASRRMALQSWPPTSMTVRTVGCRKWTPFAWQVISEKVFFTNPMRSLP